MADIFKAISTEEVLSKFRVRLDKVYIENRAFRLFSRFTSGTLFLCAALVTLQQIVGKHIECILPPKEDIRQEALNQYCFIMGTYTVPHLYNFTVGIDVAHPGVGTFEFDKDSKNEQHFHTWYQWVPMALFFQGITFLVPHMIWKALEKERIKAYCDLEVASNVNMKSKNLKDNSDPKMKEESINRAAVYFVGNMRYNKFYAFSYVICEWLNLAELLFNFYFTDKFLGSGDFSRYGAEVVEWGKVEDTTNLISPMDRVFPKVSKCDFMKFGPSGSIIKYDILCVLAINIINEKIYVFLWFWFIILGCVGILSLIYRLVVILLPGVRNALIRHTTDERYISHLDHVLEDVTYPDWFVLRKLNANINPIRFGEFCQGIERELMKKTPEGRLSSSPLPAYTESNKSFDKDPDEESAFLSNKDV